MTEDISQIGDIIAENQDISRGQLFRKVCQRPNCQGANVENFCVFPCTALVPFTHYVQ